MRLVTEARRHIGAGDFTPWKERMVAKLGRSLEYAQGNMTWDDVVKQTTDCWASEKALLAQ